MAYNIIMKNGRTTIKDLTFMSLLSPEEGKDEAENVLKYVMDAGDMVMRVKAMQILICFPALYSSGGPQALGLPNT